MLLIKTLYLIYKCFWSFYHLSVHFHSCCFYMEYCWAIREITTMPVYIFCFILFSKILTPWRNIRIFYTTSVLTIQKRSRFEPVPQPTNCSYAPVSLNFDNAIYQTIAIFQKSPGFLGREITSNNIKRYNV